jgi:hypothetical protein
MNLHLRIGLLSLFLVACGITTLRAETPEEWVKLGARVHGGFGAFIPVGIRIGGDAMKRLRAQPVSGLLRGRRRALPLFG